MSKKTGATPEGLTIVGGRPMHRAVAVSDLPVGLEQVLTIAALDHNFRKQLSKNPRAAAESKGITLDETEHLLLASQSPKQLAKMANRMVIPKEMTRRRFVKSVAASVLALVGSDAFLLCSGCTGADTWDYDAIDHSSNNNNNNQLPEVDEWATLGGHQCYLYIPSSVVSNPEQNAPLLLALHDQGENCLSNVQRWRSTADAKGFSLVSINWNEEPPTETQLEQLINHMPEIIDDFSLLYSVDLSSLFLCSRGASTPLVWRAGFENNSGFFAGAIFLGGIPDGAWGINSEESIANLVADPPALYHVTGEQDDEYSQMMFFSNVASARGVKMYGKYVEGTSREATLHFGEIWDWISQFGGTSSG